MITDLLGTPSLDDIKHVTSRKSIKSLLSQRKPAAQHRLYELSPNSTVSHGAVHLLSQLLVFKPVSSYGDSFLLNFRAIGIF